MDKNTLSNYGWIVIAVLVLSVMIALATPFGQYVENAVWSVTEGLFTTQDSALDIVLNDNRIKINSDNELYALGRVLQISSIKSGYIAKDSSYNIQQDLNLFTYPKDVTSQEEKISYLQTASYVLTKDVELNFAKVEGKGYFTGIGSVNYPFMGTFNGNGNTITLTASENLDLSDVADYGTGLFDTVKNAKIYNVNINVESDIIVTAAKGSEINVGIVAGRSTSTEFSNCSVKIMDSIVGINYETETTIATLNVAGISAQSDGCSIFRNCNVELENSTLMALGNEITNSRSYGSATVGGIVGFSGAGSSNNDNIGRLGTQLYNCSFVSNNDSVRDVIVASAETCAEVTAGGLVGCTFNNMLVKDSFVNIIKGNIYAFKTGEQTYSSYGSQAGGIVGRLEHTGEITGCSVSGDNLTIFAKSPNSTTSAGGIVGVDMGAFHRDIDTINNCNFDGSGTSEIKLEITTSDTLTDNRAVGAGGIVGIGSYIVSNCSVKNVKVSNSSVGMGNPTTYVGELAGYMALAKDNTIKGIGTNFTSRAHFVPRTTGFYNCTADKVTIIKTSNVQNLMYENK